MRECGKVPPHGKRIRMVGKFNCKYLTGKSKVYNNKTYCDVTLMQGSDVKNVSCDEKCFPLFKGHEMEDVVVDIELIEGVTAKGAFKMFKVVGMEVLHNGK